MTLRVSDILVHTEGGKKALRVGFQTVATGGTFNLENVVRFRIPGAYCCQECVQEGLELVQAKCALQGIETPMDPSSKIVRLQLQFLDAAGKPITVDREHWELHGWHLVPQGAVLGRFVAAVSLTGKVDRNVTVPMVVYVLPPDTIMGPPNDGRASEHHYDA